MIIHLDGAAYTKFSYPAHEFQVRLTAESAATLSKNHDPVTIVARDLNPLRFMELALLRDAIAGIDNLGLSRNVDLVIPYLPYARADRRFTHGDCHGLMVLGRTLFAMSFSRILTLDVHSGEARKCVSGLENVSPEPLIEHAINDFAKRENAHKLNLLFPDEGAAKRYKLHPIYGCNTYAIETLSVFCWKKRDPVTGEMLGFEVPDPCEFDKAPILIIDDICDGGATFIGIAASLARKGITPQMGLYVTHGIFSKGTAPLYDHFKTIYTTDSFTHDVVGVKRMPCLPLMGVK